MPSSPWQVERLTEVGQPLVDGQRGEPLAQLAGLAAQRSRVAVDRHDPARRPEQIGQGQGECAATGPEVRPARAAAGHALADEPHVIGVVHCRPS